jgi:hypothetical protein
MLRNDGHKNTRSLSTKGSVFNLDTENAVPLMTMVQKGDIDETENNSILLEELIAPLCLSDSFSNIIDQVSDNWLICLDQVTDGGYLFDSETKTIWIDHSGLLPDALSQSVYFKQCIRHNLLKAIRDIWHHDHFQDFYDELCVESYIKSERARSADVECFALLCAYEISLSDSDCRLWQHIMSSETGDLAIQFQRYLERGIFSKNTLDLALQRAFKQWYEDPTRISQCDHRTLEELDDLLMWDKDALMDRNAFLDCMQLAEMTQHPSGPGSYLGDLNIKLLESPEFCAIHDNINRIHFSHIKRDLETVSIGDVQFRSESLAEKIFPIELSEHTDQLETIDLPC